MKIKVLFWGVLAEIAGTEIKIYENIKTIEQLEQRIFDDYPELFHYKYQIALNNSLIYSSSILKDEDEIALIPPFEGG